MSYSKILPAWASMTRVLRNALAVALIGGSGVASAGIVTFDEAAMDSIFSQDAFGLFDIDIRFNTPLSVIAPALADINSDAEFSGGVPSLGALATSLGVPAFTVSIFFVDKISYCGGTGSNIIGCGSNPGSLIALNSDAAAGSRGAALMAHELGHNLGLSHLAGGGNLMNSSITGVTTLSTSQVGSFVDLTTGASKNSIVQSDAGQLYISITPIAVLAAAPVPEPETWAMLSLGLLGVAGWARRRRACVAA
jgi:hypothetical protein